MMRVSPGAKAIEDRLAVFAGGRAVHVLGGDARLEEALGDVLRMAAIDAEAERRPSLAALEPSLDDVAGDDGAIHRLGKLAFVEIAGDGRTPARSGSLGAKATKSARDSHRGSDRPWSRR